MQLPTRRRFLAGGGLGLLAACTTPRAAPSFVVVDPDVAIRQVAASREEALLQLYAETVAAFPQLGALLTALSNDHAQHRSALGAAPGPLGTATPQLVGRTAQEARLHLAALERSTATAHAAAAITASRRLAPVLASLAACESAHAVLL